MRRFLLVVAFCTILPAAAEIGTVDDVPAATLLLPYFEVDTGSPEGDTGLVETTFSIHNVDNGSQLLRVVLYTQWGIPTVGYDFTLPAYGSTRVDLAEILRNNSLALGTDDPVVEPLDDTPPGLFSDGFESGDLSDWSVVEARASHEEVVAYHTGAVSPRTGKIAGPSGSDGRARGYVCVDVVKMEDLGLPDDPGYMEGLSDDNAIIGTYRFIDHANNASFGSNLVHIEASFVDALVTTPGNFTFYSRFVNNQATDHRETLPAQWAVNVIAPKDFDANVPLHYWRNTGEATAPLTPGVLPPWYPLPTVTVSAVTTNSTIEHLVGDLLPLACGRVTHGEQPLVPSDPSLKVAQYTIATSLEDGVSGTNAQFVVLSAPLAPGRFQAGTYGTVYIDPDSKR